MTKLEADKLFNTGKKVYTKTFKIVYLPTTDVGEVIISAPIKIFKRANKRNLIKRLVRESIRGLDFLKNKNLFIIYNCAEIKTFAEIKSELGKVKI